MTRAAPKVPRWALKLGFTQDDANALWEKQKASCGLCGALFAPDETVHLDHHHGRARLYKRAPKKNAKLKGKIIRRFVHFRCNTLYIAQNNLITARALVRYMEDCE